MTTPLRLQLSRRKGFNLQALSMATNGLAAVNVGRGSRLWGNPFVVNPDYPAGHEFAGAGRGRVAVPTVEDAVACYRDMLAQPGEKADAMRAALPQLRGRNLACWCRPGSPCHADVLLDLANRPTCEEA